MNRIAFIALVILSMLLGCRRGDPSWETGLVVPIAQGSLSIDNLINDSLTSNSANGGIDIDYTFLLNNLATDSLVSIPDTALKYIVNLPISLSFSPGAQIASITTSTFYSLGEVQLINGRLKSGSMRIDLQNDVMQPVDIRYRLPYTTKNGIPFDTLIVVPAAPNPFNGSKISAIVNLAGYEVDFRGPNFNQSNTIVSQYTIGISSTATGFQTITPDDSMIVSALFSGVVPEYARGYFGSTLLQTGSAESFTDVFSRITGGTFGLEALRLELGVKNYIGVDARMQINQFWSRNSSTGQTVNLTAPLIGQSLNFNRAIASNNFPPSIPSTKTFVFDNSNSNIKALIENQPDYIGYNLDVLVNPLGNVSGNNDFYYTDWGINASLHVLMPLSFYADQLKLMDTLDIDFSSLDKPEAIGAGKLTLYATNEFPFSAQIMVYLLDETGTVSDSIVAQPNLIAAGISSLQNAALMSTGSVRSTLYMPLDASRVQRLLKCKRLLIKSIFDTNSNPGYVRLRPNDKMDIQITADFNYTFEN